MRQLLMTLVGLALVCAGAQQAWAETTLQLYIEGATYDEDTETWVKTMASSGDGTIRLWAIGNTGALDGPILDVKLAVAYSKDYDDYGVLRTIYNDDGTTTQQQCLDIHLTPSRTGDDEGGYYHGFYDPEPPPEDPYLSEYSDEGDTPKLNDGSDLPSHGVYGEGIAWQEFYLDHFNLVDSPIIDFIAPDGGLLPDAPDPLSDDPLLWQKMGQINVYEVKIYPGSTVPEGEDFHGLDLHFDLYNHVLAKDKTKTYFAPFSHTTDGEANFVPAPPAYVGLIGMALMGLVGYVWQKRRGR